MTGLGCRAVAGIFAYRERNKIAVACEALAWLETLAQAAERIDKQEAEAIFASGDAMGARRWCDEPCSGDISH